MLSAKEAMIKKKFQESIDLFTEIIKIEPDNFDAIFSRGIANFIKKIIRMHLKISLKGFFSNLIPPNSYAAVPTLILPWIRTILHYMTSIRPLKLIHNIFQRI